MVWQPRWCIGTASSTTQRRGDWSTGDDITNNIRTIRSVPLVLSDGAPPLLEVRGEIYMPNEAFAAMNAEREEAGLPTFVNPRNASARALGDLRPEGSGRASPRGLPRPRAGSLRGA